ncbi:hypothetical protein DPMN_094385 [Dreissena polymorpha]|uniref:Uncharacterized protein n=1 Tax=Dreissena polymorpha TaxID=45954 RepID=A0A9D4L613_DREPO|nr:hypothetical protein DPMN_094385 [Dreissena polymorpha]
MTLSARLSGGACWREVAVAVVRKKSCMDYVKEWKSHPMGDLLQADRNRSILRKNSVSSSLIPPPPPTANDDDDDDNIGDGDEYDNEDDYDYEMEEEEQEEEEQQ